MYCQILITSFVSRNLKKYLFLWTYNTVLSISSRFHVFGWTFVWFFCKTLRLVIFLWIQSSTSFQLNDFPYNYSIGKFEHTCSNYLVDLGQKDISHRENELVFENMKGGGDLIMTLATLLSPWNWFYRVYIIKTFQ